MFTPTGHYGEAFGFDAVLRRRRQAFDRVGGAPVAGEHDFVEKDVNAADENVVESSNDLVDRGGGEARMAINLQHRLAQQRALANLVLRRLEDDDDPAGLADVLHLPRFQLQHGVVCDCVAGADHLTDMGEDAVTSTFARRDAEPAEQVEGV
jgi:hypothetical protein